MSNKSNKRAEKEFRRNAQQFRELLLAGRESYAKGRAFDAVELQNKALKLGAKSLPRFEDHSLVKAHALVEMGLAYSAICTDFASGAEWQDAKTKMERALDEALGIYQRRRSERTLTVFRREECWLKGDKYASPVPHTERLGPIDYLSCALMSSSGYNPSKESIQRLKSAIQFGLEFKAAKCVIRLEAGPSLQAELPADLLLNIKKTLKEQEHVVAGGDPDCLINDEPLEEVRHTGTRHGHMKQSHVKLAADMEKRGFRQCSYTECDKQELQPRQFATCSRCKWAPYCCREHQRLDWKRHKKECGTVAAEQRKEFKEMIRSQNTLMPGQVQQFLTVVRYLHYFLVQSPQVQHQMPYALPLPSLNCPEDHMKLNMMEIGTIWDYLWGMKAADREQEMQRFVQEMENEGFDSKAIDGPPFSVVLDWDKYHVAGIFVVVEHTPSGSILLHDKGDSGVVAYRVLGISESIETIMKPMSGSLPQVIRTALVPFKGVIVTHGCLAPGIIASGRLQAAAATWAGEAQMDIVTSLGESES